MVPRRMVSPAMSLLFLRRRFFLRHPLLFIHFIVFFLFSFNSKSPDSTFRLTSACSNFQHAKPVCYISLGVRISTGCTVVFLHFHLHSRECYSCTFFLYIFHHSPRSHNPTRIPKKPSHTTVHHLHQHIEAFHHIFGSKEYIAL